MEFKTYLNKQLENPEFAQAYAEASREIEEDLKRTEQAQKAAILDETKEPAEDDLHRTK